MSVRSTRHVLVIGTLLAGLILAGCATPETIDRTTPEDSLARVQGAAAKVTEARSARISMTMTTTFAGEQVPASTATTQGVYDYAAHKGQMDTTIKSAGLPFRTTQRTLVIGSTTYLKIPDMPEGEKPPPGVPPIPEEHHKPWIKVELPKEFAGDNPFSPGFGPVPDDSGGDPTQVLSYLKSATTKVERVGSEQVRGTPTTRYTATLDAGKVAAQAPEEFQSFADEMGLSFPKPADVWIDEQGRLRKIHFAMTMKVPKEMGTPATTMTNEMTMELYDFGVPVDVRPPPADQVEVIKPDQPTP
jgi:LppX_LprAFG lipoprotein